MESLHEHNLLPETTKGEEFRRYPNNKLEALEEEISPTESLISQETLDLIFQRFNSSNRTTFTPNSETPPNPSGTFDMEYERNPLSLQQIGLPYCEEMSTESTSTHSTVHLEKLSTLGDSISSWEDEQALQTSRNVPKTPNKKPLAPLPPQYSINSPEAYKRSAMEGEDFIRKPSVKKTRAPDIPPKLPPRECRQEKKENFPARKDPAEMSLKERLDLFECNRGKPPVPKKPQNISSGGIREKIATLFSSNNESKKDVDSILSRHGIRKHSNNAIESSVVRPLLPPPPAPPAAASPGKRKSATFLGEEENIEMIPIVAEEPKRPKQQDPLLMQQQVNHGGNTKLNQPEAGAAIYPQKAISYDEDSSSLRKEEGELYENAECRRNTQSVLKSLLESSYGFAENSDSSANDFSEDDELQVEFCEEHRVGGSISSESFLYQRNSQKPKVDVIREEEIDEQLHSVSFYRKQQTRNQLSNNVEKTVVVPQHIESKVSHEEEIQEKIKKLKEEIHRQQQIISQTSQALNLCAATVEFCGSTEAVEGERHLLVANHRRLAALNELQRINVEGSLHPKDSPPERGTLRVTGITLPLAQSYIREMATNTIPGHHLLCLLKYNDHVLATQTIVTLPGLVAAKFSDELQLPAREDFRVTLEVYGMPAQREILSHELKYHIAKGAKKFIGGSGTPMKRLRKPIVESPAGPQAVRAPTFIPYGSIVFTMRDTLRRTTWSLNRSTMIPDPLEGIVHMRVLCHLKTTLEHRGFLTMFDDVSGFGAWHRRWCFLSGTTLTYWKYPDDEGSATTPIGSIDLKMCGATRVGPVPRDICARLNTLLLEIERPRVEEDKESLVLICRGNRTIVRHLLATDTKDDREEWCKNLNQILALIKCWGSPK